MAGIYLHIPFCKKKCHYCNFYSTTNSELKDNFIIALKEEVRKRENYLDREEIKSIYFGGGSPSMLSIKQVQCLMDTLKNHFKISPSAEITFECNPDDLNTAYCKGLKNLGINRLSIGIQSFDDEILKFLNRRHTSKGGEEAIYFAKEAGFNNISIDLMFGIPGMTNEIYRRTLGKALDFKVNHISAYHLSIEPKTVLYKKFEKGFIGTVEEDTSLFQFDLTIEKLKENGYRHYEISNYAIQDYESRHNWLYWSNGKYLGLGPSAHSYDGKSRQWNVENTKRYIDWITDGIEYFEREELREKDKYNEYILTALRTCKGVSVRYIEEKFDKQLCIYFKKILYKFAGEGYICEIDDRRWALNKRGLMISELVIREFYYG